MRIARQIGLVLVTVGALCAMTAASASAGTPLFLFHGTGGRLLASSGSSTQTLVAGGHTVACTAVQTTQGTATALRFLAILVRVQYSACKAEGEFEAIVDPVHYIIDANGSVALASTAFVLVPSIGCTITIPSSKNQSLTTVKFENTTANSGILLLIKVAQITSTGAGTCAFAEEHEGTDTGTIHLTADGGLLKWDLNA